MTWLRWIWEKAREAWRQARRVAGLGTAIERATHAYINSAEYRETHA